MLIRTAKRTADKGRLGFPTTGRPGASVARACGHN